MNRSFNEVRPEVNVMARGSMLRIGEFSRLSQVTVKALHYYDEMGLLKPAHIDPFTSYRYYSIDQLPRIHRIVAFKELGLSLEQITVLLDDDVPANQLRELFRRQRSQIQQRIDEDQVRLAQVDFRLRMIEMEDAMPELDVIVKPVPPLRALTFRVSKREGNDTRSMLQFQREVEDAIAQGRFKMTGPVMQLYETKEFLAEFEDFEFFFPVDDTQTEDVPLATYGTLQLKTIPGMPMMATYVHHSTNDEGLDMPHVSEVMPVLRRWIVENGYRLCGTHRTVRHYGPFQHAEYRDWITEYQHEIAPAENG
jgi:DNA-binding transcriptional MerR regulator